MNPRLRKFQGVWHCWAMDRWSHGLGYTPKHAYDDWLLQALGLTIAYQRVAA